MATRKGNSVLPELPLLKSLAIIASYYSHSVASVEQEPISFEIGTWFSEMITIQKGYHLIDKFTPIDDFIEEWEDCESYIPNSKREVIVIE